MEEVTKTKKLILKAVDLIAQENQFERSHQTWSKRLGDAVLRIEYQGSRFIKGGYINFLVWYPAIEPEEKFSKGNYHISFRPEEANGKDLCLEMLCHDETNVDLGRFTADLREKIFIPSLSKLYNFSDVSFAEKSIKEDSRDAIFSKILVEKLV